MHTKDRAHTMQNTDTFKIFSADYDQSADMLDVSIFTHKSHTFDEPQHFYASAPFSYQIKLDFGNHSYTIANTSTAELLCNAAYLPQILLAYVNKLDESMSQDFTQSPEDAAATFTEFDLTY